MTRTLLTIALIGAAALLSNATPAARQSPSADREQPPQAFAAGTTAVLVDVVVRDRSGTPVTDLRARDFELYEDGVRQEIASVTLVAPPASGSTPPASTGDREPRRREARDPISPPARAAIESPTVVALVFDRLSAEGRALAHRGALAYLDASHEHDFAGVFVVDQALETIQPFTNDRSALAEAIDAAAVRASSSFDPAGGKATSVNRGDTRIGASFTAGAEEHGPPVRATPTNPDPSERFEPGMDIGDFGLQVLANRMERSYEAMMHEQQGYATALGLLAVVDGLSQLPGRKTVVFFAESLLIPANTQRAFESVVAAANRANVSIYAVDAAGLRVQSHALQTATQINALGKLGTGDATRPNILGPDAGERGNYAYTKDLELNEDILRQDPAASLGMLAGWTGGFLINNTNDLERGFRRIDEDRRFHYLLAYTPKNEEFRGEYRQIAVKVPKRKVTARARHGYLALRTTSAIPLLAYEAPAVAALEASPLPSALPVRAGAFSFPDRASAGQVALVVSVESQALTVEMDRGSGSFGTDFTILARIRDASGRLVRKASQPHRLAIPAGDIEAALGGKVLFFRQPTLPPGDYTLEYVVHDALSSRSGAGRTRFTVFDASDAGLQVGSLMIVEQTERVPPEERRDDNPLFHGDTVLYPSLGSAIARGAGDVVSFALTLHPGAGPLPEVRVELRRGGQVVASRPLTLPPADEAERLRIVDELPLSAVPPGVYTLAAIVSQGDRQEVRTAALTVVD